ncbi:MAG TPA: 5-oxoprolinase subunit PxpB, partial [Rhodanobacteraceae bacterium]|nr:5-oxoprolinase subunit PxpB [Rhodanobacteraceae bacterium]
MSGFVAEPLGEDALLLRFGDSIDAAVNSRVQADAARLRAAKLSAVEDIVPAYASLLLRFDPLAWGEGGGDSPHARLQSAVDSILRDSPPGVAAAESRAIDIPVCYGGNFGPDLEGVATHSGLDPGEVVARHTAAQYVVAMLGFAPGFPYLLGLDPALHIPRRATPRTRVPAGSVAIGGAQTGIYPRELPGGWQVIGCTPAVLFDPQRDPPALLSPGDRVRFRAIENAEFRALFEKCGHGRPFFDPRDR